MPAFKGKLSRHLLAKSHRYQWAFLASFESYNSLHFVHADEVRTANYHTYKEYFNRPPLWKRSKFLVQSCPYCSTAPAKLPETVVRQTMTGFNGSISEEITREGYDVRTKLIHMNLPERVWVFIPTKWHCRGECIVLEQSVYRRIQRLRTVRNFRLRHRPLDSRTRTTRRTRFELKKTKNWKASLYFFHQKSEHGYFPIEGG